MIMKTNRRDAIFAGVSAAVAATSGAGTAYASMFLRNAVVKKNVPSEVQAVAALLGRCSVMCEEIAGHSGFSQPLRLLSDDCRHISDATIQRLIASSAPAPALCQACADACQRFCDAFDQDFLGRDLESSVSVARRCADACRSLIS